MSFPSAIAGPSRLPYRAIASTSSRAISSHHGNRSYATSGDQDQSPEPAATSSSYESIPQNRRMTFEDASYKSWKEIFSKDYEYPQPGARAKWLGKEVVSLEFCLVRDEDC